MKKLLSVLIIAVLLFGIFSPALPVSAQDPTEEPVTSDPTEEIPPTEEATPEATPTEEIPPTEEATPEATPTEEIPPTEEATPEATPTEEATPTVEPTVEPTVPITSTVEITPTVELTSTLEAAADLSAQATYASTTMFAVQNPNLSTATSAQIQIFNTAGSVVYNDSRSVNPGYAYLLDQASQTLSGFTQGSAVISAGENVGVTTLIKSTSSGATPRYETYNGLTSTDAGTTVTIPQFMRNVSSLGNVYDTLLAIQNVGNSNASVNVLYQAIYFGTTQTKSYNIPPNASIYIRSQDLTDIGDATGRFFGYAVATSTNGQSIVAVGTIQSGETGSTSGGMFAFKGFATPLTSASGEVFGGLMYKNISSASCNWNSALAIANTGSGNANITVKYYPSAGIPSQFPGGSPFSYSLNIPDRASNPSGSFISLDQRFDTNITTPKFFGTISLRVNSGQITAISNVRAAQCTPATAQFNNSVPVEVSGGSKIIGPMVFKNDQAGSSISTAFSWSTAVVIQNLSGSQTNVRVSYYPYNGGASTSYTTSVPGSSSINIDQRFDANLTAATFAGSIVVESLSPGQQIRGAINIRGNNGPASDAFTGYNMFSYP